MPNTLNEEAMQRGPARDALNTLCEQYGFDAAELAQLTPRTFEAYSNGTVAVWEVSAPVLGLHDVSVALYLAKPGEYTWDVSVKRDASSKTIWHVTPERFRTINPVAHNRKADIVTLLTRLDALGDQPVRETARVFQAWSQQFDVPVADIVAQLAQSPDEVR